MRKRPGLATEVADVEHLQADLLAHLAGHGFFERLARFDKSSQNTEEAIGEGLVARQEQLIATPNQHDHSRAEARKAEQAAVRAQLRPLRGSMHRRLTAPTAEAMRLVPQQDLDGAASNGEMFVG